MVTGEALTMLRSLLPATCTALAHPHHSPRVMAARCLSTLAAADPDAALPALLRAVRPSMADLGAPVARVGAMLALQVGALEQVRACTELR
jgi:hypothetical protein